MLKRYKYWVKLGKQDDIMKDFLTTIITLTKGKFQEPEIYHLITKDHNHSDCNSLLSINKKEILVLKDTSKPQPVKSSCYCSEFPPMTPQIPGKTWVPDGPCEIANPLVN